MPIILSIPDEKEIEQKTTAELNALVELIEEQRQRIFKAQLKQIILKVSGFKDNQDKENPD